MINALLWGALAASSLIIGDMLGTYIKIPKRTLGLIMAFGVGVVISAVSFELVETAFVTTNSSWAVALGLLAGSAVFFFGDMAVSRLGGRSHRKGEQGPGLAIMLGTALDGIPESIVIGLTLVKGGTIGVAMIVAVFLSNLPEAIGATSSLKATGWRRNRTLAMWSTVALLSALASMAGYILFSNASPDALAFTLSFADGALLTMIANSMMPEAYRDSGNLGGLITTFGFGLAFFIGALT
jgi:zinc transporter, ZIP family